MKHLFSILVLLVVGISAATAQQLNVSKNFKKQRIAAAKKPTVLVSEAARPGGITGRPHCGFARMMEKAKVKGYDEATYEAALKRMVQRRIEQNQTAFTGTVTIPVVFHCIYRTGQALGTTTPNLTAAMYQAQINQMNADYANLSGSTYGVAANVRIQFCLALVDTTGHVMAEPGIDRINGSTKGWINTNTMDDATLEDYFENTIKPVTIWDPYSYFNVWTAAMNSSGLLGYSTFPSFSTLDGLDNAESDLSAGCVINWESVGSVSVPGQDASFGFGRTLTHESGHFFGLRHIWGDASCGEDYCNDTPTQQDATTGCPSNDAANRCTAAVPTMYQNYMDYSDDACLNTFTADQALRCNAVMDNSPRRFTLMTSKACQARAGNAVSFATGTPFVISERAISSGTASCPYGRTYSFKVYVSSKATGAATLTFVPVNSTATQNIDYIINTPSVSYTTNDSAAKILTITVFDDEIAEADEQLEIGYTITGTGVAAGPDKQTIKLAIINDDVNGVIINDANPSPSLLAQNFNASANIPAGWTTEVFDDGSSSYTPNQWVVSANGGTGTSGNAAHITRNTSTKPNQYTNTNLSDAYLYTPLIDATGTGELSLSFKWRCLGEEGYDEGFVGYIPEGQAVTAGNVMYFDTAFSGLSAAASAPTATLTLPASLSNSRFYLVFNWFNDETIGTNPPFTIDDISVTGKRFSVATAAGADTTFSHFANQAINYYANTVTGKKIIATVTNPNADLACVTAAVQNAGTGKTLLSTNTGSYYRTDKVIKLTPVSANTSANYQATFYFTAAELTPTWTTSEIAAMKILKVRDGVSLSGIIDAADVQLVTPTFVDNTEDGYYSYTGSFTGFSQFMLVVPNVVVPVSLMNFNAVGNKNTVSLSWLTMQEISSRGFAIERSTDGTNFTAIGWVNGKGNSTVQSSYAFNDNFVQPDIVYYYRIRQVDADGRETISTVRQVRINKSGITVTVSPVPAKDAMNVFIKGSNQNASVSLVNAQGQVVRKWSNVSAVNSAYNLDITNLAAGIYMLNVVLPEENIVRKVVIEK